MKSEPSNRVSRRGFLCPVKFSGCKKPDSGTEEPSTSSAFGPSMTRRQVNALPIVALTSSLIPSGLMSSAVKTATVTPSVLITPTFKLLKIVMSVVDCRLEDDLDRKVHFSVNPFRLRSAKQFEVAKGVLHEAYRRKEPILRGMMTQRAREIDSMPKIRHPKWLSFESHFNTPEISGDPARSERLIGTFCGFELNMELEAHMGEMFGDDVNKAAHVFRTLAGLPPDLFDSVKEGDPHSHKKAISKAKEHLIQEKQKILVEVKQLRAKQKEKELQQKIDALNEMRKEGFELERIPGDIVDWDKVFSDKIRKIENEQEAIMEKYYELRSRYSRIKEELQILNETSSVLLF